jgi:hypothetical protein
MVLLVSQNSLIVQESLRIRLSDYQIKILKSMRSLPWLKLTASTSLKILIAVELYLKENRLANRASLHFFRQTAI